MKTLLWIPVFNQSAEFPRLLDEIRAAPPAWDQVLIVNDGSTDGTAALIHASGHAVIDVPERRGVGHSYMRALDWALAKGYDILVGIAGNGKMAPSEVGRCTAPILEEGYDYVTGSRFLAGGGYPNLPRFRRLAIPAVNCLAGLAVGRKLSDATCGFRALRTAVMRRAQFDWHRPELYTYAFEYYLFAKIILDGRLRWKEVPVSMRYPGRGKAYSKIRPFRDWVPMLKPWLQARFEREGFRHD
jgi:glycosyltransferase involved in cell wall biosynthesis